jgi:hypothetical protein
MSLTHLLLALVAGAVAGGTAAWIRIGLEKRRKSKVVVTDSKLLETLAPPKPENETKTEEKKEG